ncbi:MAG: putative zinc-finger [Candidatus Nitrotoga sp. LAW]|nr:MAG: putative zinc-finger [Candidatus Nitrotoga sp. LAW]
MMNCRNATRLMSEAQERPLSTTERMSLKLHVIMCSGCHNFKDQMGTLRLMARAYAKRKNEPMNEK